MKAIRYLPALLMSGLVVLTGCAPAGEPKAVPEKTYAIEGKVVDVKPARPSVRLDHKDVEGLMKGMEMDFDVEDRKILDGILPGDRIHGRLKVRDGRYVIVGMEKH